MKTTLIIGVSLEGYTLDSFPNLKGLDSFVKITNIKSGWQRTLI